jgi:hypothetical protein
VAGWVAGSFDFEWIPPQGAGKRKAFPTNQPTMTVSSKTIVVKPKALDGVNNSSGDMINQQSSNVPVPIYSPTSAKRSSFESHHGHGRKISLSQIQHDVLEQIASVQHPGGADGVAAGAAAIAAAAASASGPVKRGPKKRTSLYAPFNSPQDTRRSIQQATRHSMAAGGQDDDVDESFDAKLNAVLESRLFQAIIFFCTIVALFGTDFVQAFFPRNPHDMVIALLSAVILGLFAFELVAASAVKPGYIFSFFFWLDLLGALSLLADMSMLWESDLAGDGETQDTLALLRAGRIVRTGTKSTKALRLVRLLRTARIIRMFRIVKIIKLLMNRKAEEENNISPDDAPSSRLGLRLADLLGKRVILGTIFLLFILPTLEVVVVDNSDLVGLNLLEVLVKQEVANQNLTLVPAVDPYSNSDTAARQIQLANGSLVPVTESGDRVLERSPFVRDAYDLYAASFFNKTTYVTPIMVLRIDGLYFYAAPAEELRGVRPSELELTVSASADSLVAYDRRSITREQALFNMCLTLTLVFLMGLFAYLFNLDVNKYVVIPIQRTTAVIRRLANTLFLLSKEDDNQDMDMLESTFVDIVVDQLNTFFKVGEAPPSVKVAPTPDSEHTSEADLEIEKTQTNAVGGQSTDEELRQMIPSARVHCLNTMEHCFADAQALQFFKVFLTAEFALESLTFIDSVDQYTKYWDAMRMLVVDISRKYVDECAKFQVNISDSQRTHIREHLDNPTPEIFTVARKEIFDQLQRDNFQRFKKSNLARELIEIKKTKLKEYKMLKESQSQARLSSNKNGQNNESGAMELVKQFAARMYVAKWSVKKTTKAHTAR